MGPIGIAVIVWALGAGCTGGDPPVDCENPVVAVEIGTGDQSFEPLADGDPVTMVHGPQGGWHVWGSLRATGFAALVDIRYTIEDLDSGVFVCDQQYRVQTASVSECQGEYVGMFGYLDVGELAAGDADTPPELLAGHELEMCMRATDADGHDETACVRVVAEKDPEDE